MESFPIENGDCFEMLRDDQGVIWTVLDLPPGEWSVDVLVDQPPDSYCAGHSDLVVEEGRTSEVEVILTCGFSPAAFADISIIPVRNCDTPVSKDEIALPGCAPR